MWLLAYMSYKLHKMGKNRGAPTSKKSPENYTRRMEREKRNDRRLGIRRNTSKRRR